jgi:hypothetical protein
MVLIANDAGHCIARGDHKCRTESSIIAHQTYPMPIASSRTGGARTASLSKGESGRDFLCLVRRGAERVITNSGF